MQVLALVDCNNFYVSCERVFRPDLKDKPVVVLSNNDGCVVARSNEVKELGVKMGEPWFKIQDLARRHHVVAFSSNYALYADMSNRVMGILSTFAPAAEVYSIDECFLDLTGLSDKRERGYEIKQTVARYLGIPVCVGIGHTKTLAKLANHVAKKHPKSQGVFDYTVLSERQQESVLKSIEVGEVWGIGRRLSASLQAQGIETVVQLKDANPKTMRAKYGVVMERVIAELNGTPCLELTEVEPPKQQIISSRSFGKSVLQISDLKDAVAHFVSNAAAKLRSQGSVAGMLQVFILTNRFKPEEPQYNPCFALPMPVPTDDTMVLTAWAMQGLDAIFKSGHAYKKAGVMLSEIGSKAHGQFDLFACEEEGKLTQVMDKVNARFGKGAVKLAQDGARNNWVMRQDRKSPGYTTNWSELPVSNG
jgi:DNA polymerase V